MPEDSPITQSYSENDSEGEWLSSYSCVRKLLYTDIEISVASTFHPHSMSNSKDYASRTRNTYVHQLSVRHGRHGGKDTP